MDFETYHAAILDRTRSYSAASKVFKRRRTRPADLSGKKAKRLTAAAALVISERGEDWCRRNPKAFESSVLSKLGIAAKLAMTIFGIFSGGGIWIALAKILIPAVITFLVDRNQWPVNAPRQARFGLLADLSSLTDEASQILKGSK